MGSFLKTYRQNTIQLWLGGVGMEKISWSKNGKRQGLTFLATESSSSLVLILLM